MKKSFMRTCPHRKYEHHSVEEWINIYEMCEDPDKRYHLAYRLRRKGIDISLKNNRKKGVVPICG